MSGRRSWEPSSKEIAVVMRAVGFAAQYDATANLARVTGVRAQIAAYESAKILIGNATPWGKDAKDQIDIELEALRKELA